MLSEERRKEVYAHVFGSDPEQKTDPEPMTVHESSPMIWIIAVLCLAVVIGILWFFLASSPYDETVSHLRSGMSIRVVGEQLGFPNMNLLPGMGISDSVSHNGGPLFKISIDPNHSTIRYQKPDANEPLILEFEDGQLKEWCLQEKCHAFE